MTHLFFGSSRNLGHIFLIIPVRGVHPKAVKVGCVPHVEQRFRHAEEEEAEVEVGQEALGHIQSMGTFLAQINVFRRLEQNSNLFITLLYIFDGE